MTLDRERAAVVKAQDVTPEAYKDLSITDRLTQQSQVGNSYRLGEVPSANPILREVRPGDSLRRYRRAELMAHHRHLDLDDRERSVVDALDTTMDDVSRQRRPYSVQYATPPRFRSSQSIGPSNTDAETYLATTNADRSGYRPYQPRRRTSVVLSESPRRHLLAPNSPRARLSASPGRMTDDEDMPPMSTNDLTPSRGAITSQPRTSDIPTSDPWHVIQSALETARRTDGTGTAQPNLQQIEEALEAERQLGMQLEQQLGDERQLSMHLRRQLDSHSQLLQARQRELASISSDPSLHDLSFEDVLQHDLATERRHGDDRAAEIEEEIRHGTVRTRSLENVRDSLIYGDSHTAEQSSPSAAHSSALPTTTAATRASNNTDASISSSSAAVRVMESTRSRRIANIEDLQQQVRLAEARVRRAGSDLLSLEAAMLARSNEATVNTNPSERLNPAYSDDIARSSSYRFLPDSPNRSSQAPSSDRPSYNAHVAATRAAVQERLRAQRGTQNRSASISQPATNAALSSNTIPATARAARSTAEQTSQTSSDLRLARMMMYSGSSARAMDANGNWVGAALMQRMLNQNSTTNATSGSSSSNNVAEIIRDVGVGTAGLGWSEDGRSLFAGTEEGIFQFNVNLRDRMTFPVLGMR
ncbi:uncharacterized protein AB675_4851 [Cyphellophora attinorum]|uniref:DUF2415 domain-containing protein n=1 Tax=Cyphellophora attinorum TaxID=1664694 RepID=A0A0N1NW79_9EURO|nr:uncharacterized protein AB675_4851 [Phialophora attinorum]KPI34823.1 hypothetical protein AB675_4851 [Phialophora attinorum]